GAAICPWESARASSSGATVQPASAAIGGVYPATSAARIAVSRCLSPPCSTGQCYARGDAARLAPAAPVRSAAVVVAAVITVRPHHDDRRRRRRIDRTRLDRHCDATAERCACHRE